MNTSHANFPGSRRFVYMHSPEPSETKAFNLCPACRGTGGLSREWIELVNIAHLRSEAVKSLAHVAWHQ